MENEIQKLLSDETLYNKVLNGFEGLLQSNQDNKEMYIHLYSTGIEKNVYTIGYNEFIKISRRIKLNKIKKRFL